MNNRFQILITFAAIALFAITFGAFIVQAQPSERAVPEAASYKAVLGKSLDDTDVAGFIASNCTQPGSFRYCRAAGLALWVDANQTVRLVYLYLNDTEDIVAYKGELPFGLAPTDTMADVEYKLGGPVDVQAPQAGWKPGLPDEGYSRNLTYYWAIYERFGMTVIYNTPAANDKDATIHAIVVTE